MIKEHKILFQISIIIIASFLTISFSSCRENIITNENSLGNINEPVKSKTPESYSFEINASKITFNETDETQLNITNADIFISVSEYSSGFVSITVIGDNLSNLYSTSFTDNGSSPPQKITNHVPEKIKVNFQNFSGKLKISINRTIF